VADAAELVVRIRGDASDLEATISSVESELSKLEQTQSKNNNTSTKGLTAYKKQMQDAQTTLQTSRTALTNTKKAYEDNVKSVNKNVTALKAQKTELDKQISLRSNEKRLLTEANKGLDKNSVAYKDNQKALNWVNTEIEAYTKQSQSISDSIRTQEAALSGSKKAYTDAQATVKKATEQYEEYEKGLKAAERAEQAQNLQNTGKRWKEVGEGIDTVTKPLQYAATALAAGGVASAKFAIDFEDSFAGVKKTVDATPEQLAKIKQGIIDLSTTGIDGRGAIPQTTTELNELAAAGGQLGISQENIIDFTEVMAQMGSATNLVGEEGAATLARFQNVMGVGQNEIRNIGSAIVDLGNHSATTESEIAAMALRMGKYGSSVRMSAADVLGYSAALSSLGIEAQMGGSAIGRTWLSIETAVASGGEGLTKFAKYSGKSAKEFKEQWNTDSSGAFNGLLKGLQSAENLTLALDDLGINNTQDIQAMMALVNGYDLVTESVNRSNTAYQENTALQEEFNAKNETTASKLANTKNNIIEAARSIGETMLPSIQDASTTVANFAKGLSQMSDEQKKVVVNTGATVIALGAITKGSTGLIKWAGNTVEAVGNLKKAFSAGGALAKFAPTLTSIGAAAGPAALAVAGIATAAIVGKVAYDKWYQSQYKWSDGLAEGNEKVKESIEKYKALNEAQTQIKALKMVIESPESSQEQVDNAKSKLEEIKEMLSQEYNLVINSDNSNLEETVETVKNMSKLELTENIYSQMNKLSDLQPKFDSYKTDKSNLEAQASAALKARNEYAELKLTMADLRNEYQNSNDIEKYKQGLQGVAQQLGFTTEVAEQLGMAVDSQTQVANLLQLINGGTDTNGGLNGLKTKSDEYEGLTKKINNLTNAYNEYISISEEMATQSIDLIGMSAKESDSEGVQKNLERVGELVKNADLDMNRYAQSAALAMNGIDNLSTAWEQAANGDGTALNGVINDYIRSMTEFGASSAETAVGVSLLNTECTNMQDAVNRGKIDDVVQKMNETGQTMGLTTEEIVEGTALIKNGFDSVSQAIEKGDINGILKDMMSEGSQQGIDMTADKLTEMSRAMGLIPNEKRIKITADGFEVVDDLTAKVRQLEGKQFVVTVDTEGNTDGVDNVEKKTKQLDGKQCEVMFTADGTPAIATIDNTEYKIAEYDGTTGTAKLIAENGEAIGVIDLTTGKINLIPTTHDTEITAQDNTSAGVESAKANLDTVKDKTVTLTVQTVQVGGLSNQNVPAAKFGSSGMFVKKAKKAKGTQNFEGGLAMVNDEKGISDPRELIVDKGRAFIPQGKDVVLPLSKGAKVYTASQTKAIMNGMGIPHYATGKDNSDAFTSAKDDWTHYTKTHAVTTAQELEKWLEFQEKFKSNDKDIADIEEQIFSIMQKQTQEFNEQSKAYLEKHSAINDWGDNGDTPLDAFKRIKDRNYQDLQDAKITWDDYVDNVSDAGETLYDDMKSYSDSWLEHQQKYHNMSIDDYIAGIDREAERLEEFYANDVINYQKYVEEKQALEEKRYDAVARKNADEYSAWQKDADAWRELRSTYDDWDKYGDSEEDFLKRKIDRVKEFYNAGKISFEEFIDDTNKYSMELYKSQSSAVDELLQKQQDYISNVKDEFSKQEQELRDSWDVQDRKTDMSEVQAQLDVYANSVTDKGQQKYKELQEQMKQLQRDEELYQLQKENNATIESLEAEYKQMEDGKKNILTGLQNADINISAYVATITDKVSATGGNIESLLSRLLDKFDSFKIENNSMSDNRKIINNFMQMTPEEKQDALNKYVGL
jgi:TP901 family phage tail tape measure protein